MEPGILVLCIVLAWIVGVIAGTLVQHFVAKKGKTMGTIYAYYADPVADPSLLLEYNASINDIASRRKVTFAVETIHKYSQK